MTYFFSTYFFSREKVGKKSFSSLRFAYVIHRCTTAAKERRHKEAVKNSFMPASVCLRHPPLRGGRERGAVT